MDEYYEAVITPVSEEMQEELDRPFNEWLLRSEHMDIPTCKVSECGEHMVYDPSDNSVWCSKHGRYCNE
jgi:hypothetical protein